MRTDRRPGTELFYFGHKKSAVKGAFFRLSCELTTQAKTLDQVQVTLSVLAFQVVKQLTTLTNHAQQTVTLCNRSIQGPEHLYFLIVSYILLICCIIISY